MYKKIYNIYLKQLMHFEATTLFYIPQKSKEDRSYITMFLDQCQIKSCHRSRTRAHGEDMLSEAIRGRSNFRLINNLIYLGVDVTAAVKTLNEWRDGIVLSDDLPVLEKLDFIERCVEVRNKALYKYVHGAVEGCLQSVFSSDLTGIIAAYHDPASILKDLTPQQRIQLAHNCISQVVLA
jgi:hypothetical protein